VKGDIWDL